MKTRLLAALILALGLAAATTQAAEADTAARFAKAVTKLQKADVIDTATADYLKQNATGEKGSKCETAKIVPIVIAIVNKTGGNASNLDEAIEHIAAKKMVGNAETQRKLLTPPTISGTATRNLLMRLSGSVK